MNVCFEYLGGMCALFYENRLGIKKSVYLFCPNTGTTFREHYHLNHVIPHRDKGCITFCWCFCSSVVF